MRRSAVAALVAAIAAASPAAGQQVIRGTDFSAPPVPQYLPPRPADTGKPIIYDPQFLAKGDADKLRGCSPGLKCRLQVLGVIQNNGAVELRATAFRW
jgi:hypothetical protein